MSTATRSNLADNVQLIEDLLDEIGHEERLNCELRDAKEEIKEAQDHKKGIDAALEKSRAKIRELKQALNGKSFGPLFDAHAGKESASLPPAEPKPAAIPKIEVKAEKKVIKLLNDGDSVEFNFQDAKLLCVIPSDTKASKFLSTAVKALAEKNDEDLYKLWKLIAGKSIEIGTEIDSRDTGSVKLLVIKRGKNELCIPPENLKEILFKGQVFEPEDSIYQAAIDLLVKLDPAVLYDFYISDPTDFSLIVPVASNVNNIQEFFQQPASDHAQAEGQPALPVVQWNITGDQIVAVQFDGETLYSTPEEAEKILIGAQEDYPTYDQLVDAVRAALMETDGAWRLFCALAASSLSITAAEIATASIGSLEAFHVPVIRFKREDKTITRELGYFEVVDYYGLDPDADEFVQKTGAFTAALADKIGHLPAVQRFELWLDLIDEENHKIEEIAEGMKETLETALQGGEPAGQVEPDAEAAEPIRVEVINGKTILFKGVEFRGVPAPIVEYAAQRGGLETASQDDLFDLWTSHAIPLQALPSEDEADDWNKILVMPKADGSIIITTGGRSKRIPERTVIKIRDIGEFDSNNSHFAGDIREFDQKNLEKLWLSDLAQSFNVNGQDKPADEAEQPRKKRTKKEKATAEASAQ